MRQCYAPPQLKVYIWGHHEPFEPVQGFGRLLRSGPYRLGAGKTASPLLSKPSFLLPLGDSRPPGEGMRTRSLSL